MASTCTFIRTNRVSAPATCNDPRGLVPRIPLGRSGRKLVAGVPTPSSVGNEATSDGLRLQHNVQGGTGMSLFVAEVRSRPIAIFNAADQSDAEDFVDAA